MVTLDPLHGQRQRVGDSHPSVTKTVHPVWRNLFLQCLRGELSAFHPSCSQPRQLFLFMFFAANFYSCLQHTADFQLLKQAGSRGFQCSINENAALKSLSPAGHQMANKHSCISSPALFFLLWLYLSRGTKEKLLHMPARGGFISFSCGNGGHI